MRHEGRENAQSLLIVIAVLGFLAVAFGAMTVTLAIQGKRAELFSKQEMARQVALGATEAAIQKLRGDTNEYDALNEPWHGNKEAFLEVSLGNGTYRVYHVSDAGETVPGPIDEESKLNVNTADGAMLRSLPAKAMTEKTVDAILKRRNEAPFLSIRELIGLGDLDWDRLNSPSDALPGGLICVLTVYGGGKINLNTACAAVLNCLPGLNEEDAAAIVAYRNGEDKIAGTDDDVILKSVADVRQAVKLTDEQLKALSPWTKIASDYFSMNAEGYVMGRHPIRATYYRVVRRKNGKIITVMLQELPSR